MPKPFDSVLSFLGIYPKEIMSTHKDLFIGMIITEFLMIVKIYIDSISEVGKLLGKSWYPS